MKSDIQIAQEAQILPISEIAKKIGLKAENLEPFGYDKAKINWSTIKKTCENKHLGKLILVTSISPTPAGEGKSTITIGLGDAISNQLHKKAMITLREPSMGPVFGLKGGATGGGKAQVIPMEDINLHFTGDMHALTSAIDTLAALIDNYIYQDNKLDIDPNRILFKRGIDVNDRSLRQITIGQGSKFNGIEHKAGFTITVANELMAILCLANDINDLKRRIGNILVAFTKNNKPVYVKDLGYKGAIAAVLSNALKPNLVQTIEHTPALIHGGPFANIAHGANSVMATNLALHLSDYTLTEAGFGSDLGGQKFMDFVSNHLDKGPDASVVVATVRALKYQAEGTTKHLDEENLTALRNGFKNLERHMNNMRSYNVPVIVLINRFASDTKAELNLLKTLVEEQGIKAEIVNYHGEGSVGGIKAAQAVVALANSGKADLKATYSANDDIKTKVKKVAKKIYHADKVEYTEKAEKQIQELEKMGKDKLPVIIAKTQYSFTDNKKLLGAPTGFTLHVKGVNLKNGAGFIVITTGHVLDMPGLPKHPAALDIDVDNDGKISGLF
ncbi:formate--tetrahydrofolate ligase [Lactobacillus acetotolerans]|uniref:Formate--tetrahydrofolate ligase n=1 Tax=Lactobacillus acetotolerans TaxID=1600 RepID=A0A0D6A379_9LACO|nr:formate--tetrahydrofolate ligase [Lactobacillus acetotolerans]KRN41992.1 formate-tetrahydrofolate ligase [Lactobacillus acetotolerans DSM 20749 = JCM 3825]QFG51311.1 formate--tetrahydrofolate ligase [Lactobacillus acetotolerans]QGV04577.1 formate--tetrahydrofolate ligase [Lactobacillus acetotolerans]QJD73608.1 formate--tetrahydrofolate ligase [Lactobacillus acetotolerans]BAQ57278.1 formate--tetrahydrofolate ligase [Lactobacillus acetotolerans]